MKPFLTKTRIAFLLMVVLIIGSLVGANRFIGQRHVGLNQRDADNGAAKATANAAQRAGGVVATGVIAPEGNIVTLVPSVKGEVVEVLVKDEQQVKKGQVLLRLDNTKAKIDLARAENGIAAAEKVVRKAKDGLKEWELRRNIQLKQIEIRHTQYEEAFQFAEKLKKAIGATAHADVEYKIAYLKGMEALKAEEAEKLALDLMDHKKPTLELEQAEDALTEAKLLRDTAKLAVDYCELKAPADGTIMRVTINVGDRFGEQAIRPACLFYQGGLVVKADLQQEWAHKVKEGMAATIEDAGGSGVTWKGKVYYVARSFLPKRDAVTTFEGANPFAQNQELVLECRIALDPDQPAAFLNQKVRVKIGQ